MKADQKICQNIEFVWNSSLFSCSSISSFELQTFKMVSLWSDYPNPPSDQGNVRWKRRQQQQMQSQKQHLKKFDEHYSQMFPNLHISALQYLTHIIPKKKAMHQTH